MTLLCVPILVTDAAAALRDAKAAKDAGADLVEFRIDHLFHGSDDSHEREEAARLVRESPLPCIVTCRPTGPEGGYYDGPTDARIALYEHLGTLDTPPRYIDVEVTTYHLSANIRQKVHLAVGHPEPRSDLQSSLILSTHDFSGRPADLTRRVVAMREAAPAKVLKIAFLARSLRDNLELFDILAHRDRPTIALAMGECGLMSRVLAPMFGGFLTFASLRPTTTTAPGQPTIRELLDLYRFRSITPATAVYGVVGDPVAQSLSPHVHNAGFEAMDHNGVYLPLPVPAGYEHLKATLLELIHHQALNLRGLSVTIPHKEDLVRLAREQGWELDLCSTATAAANTLVIDRGPDGSVSRIQVLNTDVTALTSALADAIGPLAGKRIAVIGAGGAGRAAVAGLTAAGALVTVYNRTAERAAEVAKAMSAAGHRVEAGDIADLPSSRVDACVNCTPVGMIGAEAANALPFPVDRLARMNPGAAVMDTVYNPLDTPLLLAAREAGLRTIPGVSMFVDQAAGQFAAWTGKAAPRALFERIARERLTGA